MPILKLVGLLNLIIFFISFEYDKDSGISFKIFFSNFILAFLLKLFSRILTKEKILIFFPDEILKIL